MVKINRHGRICSLLTNASWIPKLDVAGSIPVSRSMFSITYELLSFEDRCVKSTSGLTPNSCPRLIGSKRCRGLSNVSPAIGFINDFYRNDPLQK
jgi:hypothetical protein